MAANVHPWVNPGTPDTSTFPQTDKYTDVGFDTQYQYQGDNFWFTLRGSYIHENQKLDATFANLRYPTNPTDVLNEARGYASLAYGNDNRVVLTGQYFNSSGSSDFDAVQRRQRFQQLQSEHATAGSPRSPTSRS